MAFPYEYTLVDTLFRFRQSADFREAADTMQIHSAVNEDEGLTVLRVEPEPARLNREAYADPLEAELEPGCPQESLERRAPMEMTLVYQDRLSRSSSASWKEWQGSER
jgi:hypothetical protein